MITAKQRSYYAGGYTETDVQVQDIMDAWNQAHNWFQKSKEALCITRTEFGSGAFVIRVMTQEKMLFKIQSQS